MFHDASGHAVVTFVAAAWAFVGVGCTDGLVVTLALFVVGALLDAFDEDGGVNDEAGAVAVDDADGLVVDDADVDCGDDVGEAAVDVDGAAAVEAFLSELDDPPHAAKAKLASTTPEAVTKRFIRTPFNDKPMSSSVVVPASWLGLPTRCCPAFRKTKAGQRWAEINQRGS